MKYRSTPREWVTAGAAVILGLALLWVATFLRQLAVIACDVHQFH